MTSTANPRTVASGRLPGPRDAALVAGISTFAMAATGMFANLTLVGLLAGGAEGADGRIADGHLPLRLAIAAFLVVAVLDIVVAWAIARYFGDRHGGLPMLAGWLRVGYAAVLAIGVGQLATALRLATDGGLPDGGTAFEALLAFQSTWQLGLVVFAAHLIVLGVIVIRDPEPPTLLGAIILLAGVAYATDGIARVFLDEGALVLTVLTGIVAVASIVGEIGLGVWFVLRGGRSRGARPDAGRSR